MARRMDDGTSAEGVKARPLPSGRHNLPPEEVAESQRRRLLAAMAASCAEKGYAHTTVADVVSRAGVSRATFYELFDDKEACFVAAAETFMNEALTAIRASTPAEGASWPEIVAAAVSALLELMARRPEFARLGLLEAPSAGRRAYEHYRRAIDEVVARLDRSYREAGGGDAAEPEVASLPPSAHRAAVGGAGSLLVDSLLSGRPDQLPQLLPDLLYILVLPYLGQEEALRQAERLRSESGARSAISPSAPDRSVEPGSDRIRPEAASARSQRGPTTRRRGSPA